MFISSVMVNLSLFFYFFLASGNLPSKILVALILSANEIQSGIIFPLFSKLLVNHSPSTTYIGRGLHKFYKF
jgi:hypothetical protein